MIDIAQMSYVEKKELLAVLEKLDNVRKFNYINTLFPDTGELRRERYAKHLEFFAAGKTYNHRLLMASNRIGKSLASCYELVCHITGKYPSWWEGRVFTKPTNWWICGEDYSLIRQSLQDTLLGPLGSFGTGLVPKDSLDLSTLVDTKRTSTTITSFRVKHSSGEFCKVDIKTYEQGREAFQAVAANILFDEEPPADIYFECLTRTMTLGADAMTIMNFTPLKGETELLLKFVDGHDYNTGAIPPSKHLTRITWDDAPHLTEAMKTELSALYPPYMRKVRTEGLPYMGVGVVYPVAEERVFIDPLGFSIPNHWKRVSGIDFGWTDPTVVLFGAIDPDSGILYIYNEHYLSEAPPSTHAAVIQAQNRLAGYKIPMVADPSGGGKNPKDGRLARQMYEEDYELPMTPANNSIETGIAKTYQAMLNGKVKIYNTCVNTRREFRSYIRKGDKFNGPDHAMDVLRYIVMSGLSVARSYDESKPKADIGAYRVNPAKNVNLR